MNLKKYSLHIGVTAALLICLCASCAKEKDLSSRELQERMLDAYIAENYPNAQKLSSGLTIIEIDKGNTPPPTDMQGAYIHYSTYSFDGTCQSTTDSLIAKSLGTFSQSKYYGPTLFIVNKYYTTDGMMELLKQIGKGGHIKAIIPPWLTNKASTTSNNLTQQAEISTIYDVYMGDIVDDITQYQIDTIEAYTKKYYAPGIDSTEFGFYLKNYSHPSGIKESDTIPADTYVNIWYIGRLLDGYVFDTNIKDSAKKFGLYNSSSDYNPLYIKMLSNAKTMNESQKSDEASGSSSLILGFCMALKNMTYGDHAVALFLSGYGYGTEGSMSDGSGVPWYSPLRFDIWITDKSDTTFPPKGFDGE